jgi:hypothetical protein
MDLNVVAVIQQLSGQCHPVPPVVADTAEQMYGLYDIARKMGLDPIEEFICHPIHEHIIAYLESIHFHFFGYTDLRCGKYSHLTKNVGSGQ